MRRFALVVVGSLSVASALTMLLVSACNTEPETRWGSAGNLNKDNLPGEAGLEPLECDAAAVADGGPCPVSWSKDIYPRMIGNEGWQCATSACHAPGVEPPVIVADNPDAALTSLKAYKMKTSRTDLLYVDTSKDPAKSSIECNLSGGCNPTMPIGNGSPLTGVERCNIHTWLLCGAPGN